jgi:hypothetical protein
MKKEISRKGVYWSISLKLKFYNILNKEKRVKDMKLSFNGEVDYFDILMGKLIILEVRMGTLAIFLFLFEEAQ